MNNEPECVDGLSEEGWDGNFIYSSEWAFQRLDYHANDRTIDQVCPFRQYGRNVLVQFQLKGNQAGWKDYGCCKLYNTTSHCC